MGTKQTCHPPHTHSSPPWPLTHTHSEAKQFIVAAEYSACLSAVCHSILIPPVQYLQHVTSAHCSQSWGNSVGIHRVWFCFFFLFSKPTNILLGAAVLLMLVCDIVFVNRLVVTCQHDCVNLMETNVNKKLKSYKLMLGLTVVSVLEE